MFLKLSKLHLKIGIIYLLGRTMFENSPKYLIFNFDVFPFALFKLACLVLLFARKIQAFKNSPK